MKRPEMDPGLAAFFDTMTPFLLGETSVKGVRALGDTPSADHRIHFYQRLVGANFSRIINHLFPAVRSALHNKKTWTRLCTEFASTHRGVHWDLNQFGHPFSAYLESQSTLIERHPALAQIADYEFLFFELTRSTAAFDVTKHVANPTATIRHYTHNVPQFVRATKGGPAAKLADSPMTALVYRHPKTLNIRYLQPDMPMLLAYACCIGEADRSVCEQAAISPKALRTGVGTLIASAVLGTPAKALIEAQWRD